jgi:hypothetical protein
VSYGSGNRTLCLHMVLHPTSLVHSR